jgi:hypothetical protein
VKVHNLFGYLKKLIDYLSEIKNSHLLEIMLINVAVKKEYDLMIY